jgi:hypothetical protein
LDEVATDLYYRIPLSVIGYNQQTGDFKYIGEIKKNDYYPILEWIGYLNDAMKETNLSGFVDLYLSKKPILRALDFNSAYINEILKNKFNGNYDLLNSVGIIFAGTFDRGEEIALYDYNDSFGWHGNKAKLVYTIGSYAQDGSDCNLSIRNYDGSSVGDIRIYEKFYLADSAYAIALKKDLNPSKWNCSDLKWSKLLDDDLLLFYNYRPWKGETFCGDGGEGNVTVLANNVKSFRVRKINSHLVLKIELFKQKGDINISVSKQKVAF